MRAAEREMLVSGAGELGIELDPIRAETLLKLVDELELGNAQFNLTAIRDRPPGICCASSTTAFRG